jgi:hypothetical protein
VNAPRAGLGMYPFEPLRPAYDRLWQAVRQRAPWVPDRLEWDVDIHAQWRDPATVVSYTCGWPLVTELADLADADRLHVVGTFVFAIPDADGPTYRSVLVARRPGTAADFAGARAAANGADSLSGWVSLLHAVRLPGLSANSPAEFAAKAAVLAGDLPALSTARQGLRERLRRSPLLDAKRLARQIEQQVRGQWREWCVRTAAH